MVGQLINFQEDEFGKTVKDPPLTRLPMKCFRDFKPGGGLCHILSAVYKFKSEQGWRRFDFQSRKDKNIMMLMAIEKALIQNKCYSLPVIFLDPSIDKTLGQRLKDIVKKHQGTITEKQEEATHIVFPTVAVPPEGEDWVRIVERHGRNVLLHSFFTPDSYDTWFTNVDLDDQFDPPESPPETNPEQVHEVNAKWLLDLDKYNEWMNEEDYEDTDMSGKRKSRRITLEDLMEEKKGKKGLSCKKRNRSPSPTSDSRGKSARKVKGSARSPAGKSKSKLFKDDDDEDSDDPTKDLEDPSLNQIYKKSIFQTNRKPEEYEGHRTGSGSRRESRRP